MEPGGVTSNEFLSAVIRIFKLCLAFWKINGNISAVKETEATLQNYGDQIRTLFL